MTVADAAVIFLKKFQKFHQKATFWQHCVWYNSTR